MGVEFMEESRSISLILLESLFNLFWTKLTGTLRWNFLGTYLNDPGSCKARNSECDGDQYRGKGYH